MIESGNFLFEQNPKSEGVNRNVFYEHSLDAYILKRFNLNCNISKMI